jgi:bacterioferritin-associated ferredoxin
MPGQKIILCRCEDVTLQDVEHAAQQGFLNIEEVKRYTGLGTGPCQGKECLLPACRVLAAARAAAPEYAAAHPEAPRDEQPFTVRPPLYPVTLGTLARSGEGSR